MYSAGQYWFANGLPDRVVVVDARPGSRHAWRRAARRTLSMSCSIPNSGVCTPIDDESVLAYGLGPRADVGQRPDPIDAGEGPEVDEHDLAVHVVRLQRFGVQPRGCAAERRHIATLSGGGDVRRAGSWSWSSSGCEAVGLEDGVDECVGRFLREVVPDAAGDDLVRVLAGELRGVCGSRRDGARRSRHPRA